MPSRTDPARADLEREAIRLKREEDLTEREIAARLGVSPATAHRYLRSGLDRVVAPEVVQLRGAEYARLTHSRSRLDARIEDGDLAAIDADRRLSESLRRLFGADAPQQLDIALERRSELEGAAVAEAVGAVVDMFDAALSAATIDTVWVLAVRNAALGAAEWALTGSEGLRPVLPPGPSIEAPPVVVKSLPSPPAWLEPGLAREDALKLLQADVERWEEVHGRL